MRFPPFFFYVLIFLFGCSNENHLVEIRSDNTTHFSGQAMTIDYHIIIGKPLDNKEISKITQLVKETFQEVDSVYNKWNPNSELSYLNHLKAGIEAYLSPALETFLKQTQTIVELSEGRFDPTIEPLQRLWKTKLQKGIEPTPLEIASIAPAIGWDKIHFGNGKFSKTHDLTEIDLGGIAKGFCVDLISDKLYSKGFADTYVEWGGEIRCRGKHPNNRSWTVFISRLGNTDPSQAIATLFLDNKSLATSGDYLQNWTIHPPLSSDRSIIFFHIFDPKTLRPLESSHTSLASASVAASSCAFADGLATTAMMFSSLTEAEAWANKIKEQFPEISFWLISRE